MKFIKAHGLGNDFVLIDLDEEPNINPENFAPLAQLISHRRHFVGCDQILLYRERQVWIVNADGSSAEMCGNGIRCLARLLMERHLCDQLVLETPAGPVNCQRVEDNLVKIDMPTPTWDADVQIQARNNLFLHPPVAVRVGNPHLVCFMEPNEEIFKTLGPIFGRQNTNVGFVSPLTPHTLALKVWERGAGFTESCGSGACAAVVAATVRGLVDGRNVQVLQDGGGLLVDYQHPHLTQTGEAMLVFEGDLWI